MEETDCAFCGRETSEALGILGCRICPECEARLTAISADDPDYQVWLVKVKTVWERWGETPEPQP